MRAPMSRVIGRKWLESGRIYAAVFITVLFFISFGGLSSAFAHAELVDSNPRAGSSMEKVEGKITLTWSEKITTAIEQIRVIDSIGDEEEFELELVEGEAGTSANLLLNRELPSGNWLVSWKVVSADGHLINGVVPFSVGEVGSLDGGEVGFYDSSIDSNSSFSRLDRAVEAVSWIALLISAGLLLARHFMFALLVSLITLILVFARLAEFEMQMPGFFLQIGEARSTFLVGVAALLIILGSVIRNKVSLFVGVSLITFSLQGVFSGHHLDLRRDDLVFLGSFAHFLHILAAGVWVSAVIALAVNRTLESVLRTRWLATRALFLLVFAGPLLALTLVVPVGVNSGVDWLVILGIKTLLVFLAALVGFFHHQKSGRSSEEISTQLVDQRSWRNSLGVQIGIFIFILVSSSLLTITNPPVVDERLSKLSKEIEINSELVTATERDGGVISKIEFPGGYLAELSYPANINSSSWEFKFIGELPEVLPEMVSIEATNPEAGLSGFVIELAKDASGNYSSEVKLPVTGGWQLHIDFYIDQFTKEHAMIKLEVVE